MKLNDDVRISTSGRLYDFWVLTLVVESMSLSTRRNNLAVVETIETIGGSTGREGDDAPSHRKILVPRCQFFVHDLCLSDFQFPLALLVLSFALETCFHARGGAKSRATNDGPHSRP